MASTTEVTVLITPDSPCKDYADVSYLEPSYLSQVPRDPSLATTSVTTGYTISRSQYNDIEIVAKNPEDKAIIKARCNFNGYCNDAKLITAIEYKQPSITNLNRSIFLRDSLPVTPFVITGKNFTATNTIKLFSQYTSKEYVLGSYTSMATSATSTFISIDPASSIKIFSCASSCTDTIPLGQYMLTVTNEGGVSNATGITLKGSTVSTLSSHADSSITPPAKAVKVATISIGSTVPVTFKSLTFTSTSTSTNLPAKISNFTLKDLSTGVTYNGGSLKGVKLAENASKVYDVYVDIDEVYNQDAGTMTYGGMLLVTDQFLGADFNLKVPDFSFTVSH
jgi:hypothetical protein